MDTMLDTRSVSELGLQELGFKRIPQQNKNLTFEDYPHYYRLREGYQDEIEIKNLNSTGCFVFSWGRMSCIKLETIQDVINLVKVLNRR